jgi:hypothetical protein
MPERELLFSVTKKDFKISTFSSGKGGQHQNRHNNFVRILHPPTSVTCVGTEGKSQAQNMQAAFRRVVADPKFKAWLRMETCKRAGDFDDVDAIVDRLMQPENLRVEEQVDGKWQRLNEEPKE